MIIGYGTKIKADFEPALSVQHAVSALERDIRNTCVEDSSGGDICLKKDPEIGSECFMVRADEGQSLGIYAGDDLGFIYGLYHVSKKFLGVNEFWFWNEQELIRKKEHVVPKGYVFRSEPFKVRFRGWFINDEVLLDGWKPVVQGQQDESFPWKMAFEALLRCGGNMTIPGTDFNAHRYKELAVEYGLWITHHHAEPLGARMFSRAYPELDASFDKYPELFEGLWQEAVEDQKNCRVIWNLGFRGQGDRPFWADDPAYATPKARGELMSSLILRQYELVRQSDPQAICCTNLYGETMELYRDGYLSFPKDVIRIWADNGYGRMVSRRQNNHNPRVPSIPAEADGNAHGIYYHASFYDLQAAAMMTMLPNSPDFVVKELSEVYAHGADDFWIINCSNIKPHTFYLDLIAKMWRDKKAEGHLSEYVKSYYGAGADTEIERAYSLWPKYCPKYGPNEDDHAGEQFGNHGARILAWGLMSRYFQGAPQKTEPVHELDWCHSADSLLEQEDWFEDKYKDALDGYTEYLDLCRSVKEKLQNEGNGKTAGIFDNNLICQVEYLYYSYLGAWYICRAVRECLMDDRPDDKYITAFYEAGLAAEAFLNGYNTMRSHEHGIWEGFYENDCEADIRQSHFVAKSLMSYLRVLGDGPHYYKWQRRFQQDAGGDRVLLILRLRSHLTDDEMWEMMKEKL